MLSVDHAVELGDAVALQQGLLDFVDLGHGVVGGVAELAAGVFTVEAGLHHVAEGLFVLVHGGQLLLDQGLVGGLFDQRCGGF